MIGIIFVLHGRKNKLSVANFSGIEAATKHLTLPYEIGLLEGCLLYTSDAADD